MRTPSSAAGRLALAALLALATVTCTEQPTEPGGVHEAQVRFTPVFSSHTFVAGLPIDNVTVTVVRPAADTLAVRNAPFALTDSVLNLSLAVALDAPSESLQVSVTLQHGAAILFQGTDTILVTAGDAGTAVPGIAMTYVGPGANIASLAVTPADTVLSFGDTLYYGATAIDSSNVSVASFYLHWSTTPLGTPIGSDGRIIAPNARGKIMVHALTPNGTADSTALTFIPVPTQVLKVAGDLQSDTIADTLPVPFTVQVRAADNLPVMGIPVTFAATTPGGSVLTLTAVTDSLGHASTTGVLGDTAKSYTFTATVQGLPAAVFTATANAGPAAAIAKVSGDLQSDTAGKVLPLPFVVRVADAGNNPVAGAMVVWTRLAGSGTPALDTLFTDGAGHAQLSYTLGSPGTDTVRAQLGGTGAFVDFIATASIGAVKVVMVSGDSQVDTVARTLAAPLAIQTQAAGTSTPVAAVQVIYTVTTGTGQLSADTVVTDSLGKAQVTFTLGTVAGAVQVQADAHLGGATATFHLTAVPGAPSKLAFVTLPPDTVQADVVMVPQPTVQVRDTFGNVIKVAGRKIRASTPYVLAAPPVKAGGIKFSASVTAGDSAVTDTSGLATFSGLKLSGAVGPEELDFKVDSLAVPTLIDSVHVIAGLPSTVIAAAGNGQSAYVDSLVAVAPQALVVDASGNGVKGVTVIFVVTAGGGVATGDTVVTDSLGYATVGSWRMGPTFGTDSLEARVSGLTPAVFTATANPPVPAISLALVGTNVVGVGRSAPMAIRLSAPAPVGGLVVALSSDAPSIVNVDSATASFNQGDTLVYTTLSGVAVGTANIVASGTGYTSDTLPVTGSLNLISLPTTLNVPYGGNASIAVTLSQPAPAGGIVVTLTSSDSTLVGIVTPTVTVPQGQTSANGTVHGTALGTATVAATNPNYAPDASTVSTTASLNIVNGSANDYSTLPSTQTLEFRSNGALIAAPAGGIAAALTARDTACVAVAATATIPAGLSSTTFSPSYAGTATLPCNTYVVASYPGVNPDSIAITVNPPPITTMYTQEVGSGLAANNVYGYLQVGVPTARNAVVRSLDTTKVLVADSTTKVGADSAVIPLATGTSYIYYSLRGKEGIGNDSALVTMTVPGFVPDTAWVRVRAPGVVLVNYPSTTPTTFDAPTIVRAAVGLPYVGNTAMYSYQPVRPGGTLDSVFTFKVTSATVATLIDSLGTPDSVRTSLLPAGQYYTTYSQMLRWMPLTAGVDTLTVSAPGFISLPSATVTQTISAPTTTEYTQEVGSGLASNNVYGYLQVGVPSARNAVVRSLDTTKVLVADSAAKVGADSAVIPMAAGSSYIYYSLRGKEGIVNDSALVTMTVPGYVPDTAWVRVRQPGIVLVNYPPSAPTTFDAPTTVRAAIGLPYVGNSSLMSYQPIRPGGTLDSVATFRVTNATVGALIDSVGTQDSVRTSVVTAGGYYTMYSPMLRWTPLTAGVDTLQVTAPGYVTMPQATVTQAVSAPTITLYNQDVGSGLAANNVYGYLQVGVPTARNAVIRSLDTTKVLVSDSAAKVGADSVAIPMAAGSSYIYYSLQAKEGILNDSTLVTLSVPGYVTDTAWVRVRQAGVILSSLSSTATTSSDSTVFNSIIGVPYLGNSSLQNYQPIRPGAAAPTFTIKVSTPGVGQLATSGGRVDSVQFAFPLTGYQSAYGVAAGGQAFKALTTGTDTVTVTAPGFVTLPGGVQPVTVSTPGISLYSPGTVGAGLEASGYLYLGANRHGGVNVIVKSSNPGVALIAPNDTTVGSDSIVVFVPDGQTYVSYWVQGVDSTSGTPIITASAAGFVDATTPVTIVQPGIIIAGVPSSMTSTQADAPVYAYIGTPYAGNTGLNSYQERRPGVGALTVTFDASNPAAATLANSGGTGTPLTATIVTGRYYSPFNVGSGGVAVHPVAPGSSVITASTPGFLTQTTSSATVNITPEVDR